MIRNLISNGSSKRNNIKSGVKIESNLQIVIIIFNRVQTAKVGDKLDVRDTEYIWCVGTVKIIIESPFKELLLIIHYEGWNKYFDEILPITSNRLAPLGYYTSREDIPKY